MILLVIGLGVAVWVALIAGCVYWFRSTFHRKPDSYGPVVPFTVQRVLAVLACATVIIVPLAVITGDISFNGTYIPDGCYRISTQTRVGTTIVPVGKVMTVIPTVINDRIYTPIECPA